MSNNQDRAQFINRQHFTFASVLQEKNSPTFFVCAQHARLKIQTEQDQANGDAQGISMPLSLPLQLKMPTHLQDKPQKIGDVVRNMLSNSRLIAQYTPEQLQKIQDFIAEKMKSCTSNKEKLAFGRLLEQIQEHIETIVPTLKSRLGT